MLRELSMTAFVELMIIFEPDFLLRALDNEGHLIA
jgi:hypothetical protein